jgi:hypothetical protein
MSTAISTPARLATRSKDLQVYRLSSFTRHRCFISYHHDDEVEVEDFIDSFDHAHDVFIARGIGASMPGDVIGSNDSEYIMRRIRELYLNDSTVTIVLVGACTWARRYVDWEVAASLRNTASSRRNGLMAITLPSAANLGGRQLPPRVSDNTNGAAGYARWWKYPASTADLAGCIETAFEARTTRSHLVNNSRALFGSNRACA